MDDNRHCPHCGGIMRAYTGRRLKVSRELYQRYRRCGNGCGYRDRAIVEVRETVLRATTICCPENITTNTQNLARGKISL